MKIVFLLNLDLNVRAGLFHSIHNRMKINKNQFQCEFYNVIIVDSLPLKLVKKIIGKRIYPNYITSPYVDIDDIRYKNIYYKNSLTNKVLDLLNLDYLKYRKIIRKIRLSVNSSDLIVSHWGYPHGRIAYYAKRYFNKEYIVYYHGSDIHTIDSNNEKNKKIMFEIMNNAKENIFVSKALMNKVKQLGYLNNNISYTGNGIDTNIFKLDENKAKRKGKIVGFVGNLEKIKRAEYLPDIFNLIFNDNKDVSFVIIGDGSLKDDVKSRCNDYKLPVKFTGRIEPYKVCEYMNAMDVIVLPSRNESWGCVLLEANACEVYAVATNTGGIPEVVGVYGTIVENNDDTVVIDISNAVKEVLNKNFDMTIVSNRARSFTWEKICNKEYEIIMKSGDV